MTNAVLEEVTGGFTTRWECTPPEKGQAFVVVRDEWAIEDGNDVRTIREWSPA
jgi:hypothetical protein